MSKRTMLAVWGRARSAQRGVRTSRLLLYRAFPVLIFLVVLAGCTTAAGGVSPAVIPIGAAALFIAMVFIQLGSDPTTVWTTYSWSY